MVMLYNLYMPEIPKIHCRFIDGTDGYSCNFFGPYSMDRNKPSNARIAVGVIQRLSGKGRGNFNGPHLRCIPAERRYADRETDHQMTYEELVAAQALCTKFEEIPA